MDDKDLIIFTTLYEEKNITHTAKRLFISQPALSDRLKKLEKEMGIELFIRQPRGIIFTPAGVKLNAYFKKLLADHKEFKRDILRNNDIVSGQVKFGCSNIFAKYKMPKLLSQFKELYPEIELTMFSGYSCNAYKELLQGNLQVCIARGNHNWSESKTLLWSEPLCMMSKVPLDIEDLPNQPYIHYSTDPALQDVLEDWWFSHFTKPPKTIITVNSMETCLKLVQENLGYTLLSQSCVQDSPDLIATPLTLINGDPLLRNTWMYYRKAYEDIAPVKTFVEFIKAHTPKLETP